MDCTTGKSAKSLGVITQNIDGLHEDAGSHNIDELSYMVHLIAFIVLTVMRSTQNHMS